LKDQRIALAPAVSNNSIVTKGEVVGVIRELDPYFEMYGELME
jgi:hypothetical protein